MKSLQLLLLQRLYGNMLLAERYAVAPYIRDAIHFELRYKLKVSNMSFSIMLKKIQKAFHAHFYADYFFELITCGMNTSLCSGMIFIIVTYSL